MPRHEKALQIELGVLTSYEYWGEDLSGRINQSTFASNADGCERIVSRDHPACEVGGAQSLDGRCRPWLQLVLENDETQELQTRFCLLPLDGVSELSIRWVWSIPFELLSFQP